MTSGPERTERTVRLLEMRLRDVRSYEQLSIALEPEASLTVLTGPNGVGKTNLLEAAAVVLSGASPRTSAELRLIRDGAASARIEARVAVGDQQHDRSATFVAGQGKRLELDGTTSRSVEAFAEATPAVTFLPERLLVIRGAPARRRALLDRLAARLVPGAAARARRYGSAVQQRNTLLRRARAGADVRSAIRPWNDQLVELGGAVRDDRDRVLERLHEPFARRLLQLTQLTGGTLDVDLRGGDLAAAFSEAWAADVRRGSTTVGPHLDDVRPVQAGRDLRAWGSTGEQRAALLAWTLAEADAITDATATRPVLLLDEPWGELDQERRRLLTGVMLDAGAQVIATTTEPPAHLDDVPPEQVSLRAVSSGAVHPSTTPQAAGAGRVSGA